MRALAQLAYRLTGQHDSARDLVQDVLLLAWQRWDQVSAAANQRAYVRRMLLNRHLNLMRRWGREVSTAHLPERGRGASDHDVVADRDAIWRALLDLSHRQRAGLVLQYYEGLDDAAIAELIGCRRATVRSLAARGLAALRTNQGVQPSGGQSQQRRA